VAELPEDQESAPERGLASGGLESRAGLGGVRVLVTGGASGIGKAVALGLSARQADLWIADIDAGSGEPLAADLGARFFQMDVAEPGEWQRLVAAAGAEGFEIAHLNAGVATGEEDITALGDDQYRRILGVNVDGVVFGLRSLLPAMAGRRRGSVVVTASLAGLIAFSPDPIYTLTKHALIGLVRALAPRLEAEGVRLNAVCPGLVDTPLISSYRSVLAQASFPLISPPEIAEVVLACMLDVGVGAGTGQAIVCQAGGGAVPYRFAGVPGPAHEEGEAAPLPPEHLSASTGAETQRLRHSDSGTAGLP